MIEALLGALGAILSGASLPYLIAGVMLGLALGVLPGFGGTVGLSLLLPFVYGMDPVAGLAMMIGLMSVVATADTFPAVLIGVPGSVSSQATVLDGFPLAKRGEASRALSSAFVASLLGGLFGAVVLTFVIQLARPIVLAFGTGEMLMLGIFGLTVVGVLTGASFLKGIIAACAGLLIGTIGIAPGTSEYRMEFGLLYLSNGVPLMVVAISIFAVPEIVDLLRRDRPIADRAALGGSWLEGVKDTWRNRWLALRCSGLGAVIGMLPGLGGSVIDWIAYAHAVQTSRKAPAFGEGDIRGVIAPESANNAKEGGALVPTLIFGIPGSAGTAILLGGMILLGVEPGIQMLTHDLDVVYTIIWSLAIANIFGALICVGLARPIAALTFIDFKILAPFLIALILFASFNSSRSWGDLLLALSLGIVAVFMRRFGYPRPALMIGFVLSSGLETNFYQTLQFYSLADLVTRPVFLVLVALALASVWMGYRTFRMKGRHAPLETQGGSAPQWIFLGLIFFVCAAPILLTQGLMFNAMVFPTAVASLACLCCLFLAVSMARKAPGSPSVQDLDRLEGAGRQRALLPQLLWVSAPLLIAALVGYFLAIGCFIFAFLRVRARRSWRECLLGALAGWAALLTLAHFVRLDYPGGLLQSLVTLPWPLG